MRSLMRSCERRLIAALVRMLPQAFRAEWGRDLRRTSAARLRERRGLARPVFFVRELTSLARLVLTTRLRRGRDEETGETDMYFQPQDNRPLRVAWAVALALHFALFTVIFPNAGGPAIADTDREVVVLRVYQPPPPPVDEPTVRTVKRRVRPVPIPDPDPFDPEPVVEEIYDYTPMRAEMADVEFTVSAPAGPPQRSPDVVRGGVDVTRPRLLRRVDPEYPELALRARLACFVVLEARIDRVGQVVDIEVVKSCGLGLDEAATTAVSRWHYEPTLIEGRPVEVLLAVRVDFRLR